MITSHRFRNYLTDLGWAFAFILCVAIGVCLFKGVGLLVLHLTGVR